MILWVIDFLIFLLKAFWFIFLICGLWCRYDIFFYIVFQLFSCLVIILILIFDLLFIILYRLMLILNILFISIILLWLVLLRFHPNLLIIVLMQFFTSKLFLFRWALCIWSRFFKKRTYLVLIHLYLFN